MLSFALKVCLLVLTGLLTYIKLVLFSRMSPIPTSLHQTKDQTSVAEECDKPAITTSCHHSTNLVVLPQAWWSNAKPSLGGPWKEEERGRTKTQPPPTKSLGDTVWPFLLLMGLWLGRRTPSPITNRIFLLHCCPTYLGPSSNAAWAQSHGAEVVLLQLPPF